MKRLVLMGVLAFGMSGCYATKIVSVPMRVAGALASAAPIVGNTAHKAVDEAADMVDDIGG